MMKPYPDYDDYLSGSRTTILVILINMMKIIKVLLISICLEISILGKNYLPILFVQINNTQILYTKRNLHQKKKKPAMLSSDSLSDTQQHIINNIKESLETDYQKIDDEIYKKIEDGYTSEEYSYFINLSEEERDYYMFIENSIKTQNKTDVPLRFKVLEKDINLENKSIIVKKIDENNKNKFFW